MGGCILITGSAGSVGSAIARHLVSQGRDVVGFDRRDGCAMGVDRLPLDGVDHVIHCADAMRDSDVDAYLGTVGLLAAVLNEIDACGRPIPVLFTSSVWAKPALYGLGSATFYSAGKLACEALLDVWAERRGVACVSLRVGAFDPDRRALQPFEQVLRLSTEGLAYWVDLALSRREPGHSVMTAIGSFDDVRGGRSDLPC